MAFRAVQAGVPAYRAHGGDKTDAYYGHPSGPGKYPGGVVIHHFPGWDEWTADVCREFAHHGYAAVDVRTSAAFLCAQPNGNSRVGVIGFCSGRRHAYLSACRIAELDALVDCWGGNVVMDDKSKLTERQPIAAIDLTEEPAVLSWVGSATRTATPPHRTSTAWSRN